MVGGVLPIYSGLSFQRDLAQMTRSKATLAGRATYLREKGERGSGEGPLF